LVDDFTVRTLKAKHRRARRASWGVYSDRLLIVAYTILSIIMNMWSRLDGILLQKPHLTENI
jgi:hypothetical protein